MNKKQQLEQAKKNMIYSSDKGWHIPKSEDKSTNRHPKEGGSNRLFKNSEKEIIQTPIYNEDGEARIDER